MVAERITRMISDTIRQCSDIDALNQVKQSTTLFVPALEVRYYDDNVDIIELNYQ
jgi:hypothetical protein